jgi:purine-nucleoside phosphorylase
MALDYLQQINEATSYIQTKLMGRQPEIALILGSGLGDLADQITNPVKISYRDIPHFPESTVVGHAGQFVIGDLEGKCVIAMQGRFHYYEGYAMRIVTLPVYVMKQLGAQTLVITNAAGGMNRSFQAGDLMLISDHLNMTGANPLIGSNHDELGVRFPDMSEAYSRDYRKLAHQVASEIKDHDEPFKLHEGVYSGISGPAYMTPAELTMLARLGGDAVGMSTVGEVIVARHCGLKVLGISCITDMAIGEELTPLTHEQVMATAERTKPKFIALVRGFVARVQHNV